MIADPAQIRNSYHPQPTVAITVTAIDMANLEFSPDEMQAMGEAALRRVVAHVATHRRTTRAR